MKEFAIRLSPQVKQLASEISTFMPNIEHCTGNYLVVYYSKYHRSYYWTWYNSAARPLINYEEAKKLIRDYKSTL